MFLQDAHRCLETSTNSGEQARDCSGPLGDPPSLEARPPPAPSNTLGHLWFH